MGDMGDYWREIKRSQKQDRLDRMKDAEEALPRLSDLCVSLGLVLSRPHEAHIVVRKDGKTIIQWWPSTRKMLVCGRGTTRLGVGIDQFQKELHRHA